MRRFRFFARLILICAPAPLLLATDREQAVRDAEQRWSAALTKSEFAALDRILADELIYTHSTGRTETKAQYLASLRSGALKYESVQYESLTVRLFGDSAAVAGRARIRVVSEGQPRELYVSLLHLFVLRKGVWQLAAHQTARIP